MNQSSQKNYLIYALTAIVSLLIIAIILLAVLFPIKIHQINKLNLEKNVCTTKACVAAANMILSNMDTTADPCEDFYKFTCGNFVKTHRIPDDQSRLDIFDELKNRQSYGLEELLSQPITSNDIEAIVKAKKFYNSCKNEVFMESYSDVTLLGMINKIFGDWPILEHEWNETRFDATETLIQLRLLQIEPIVDVNLSFDPKNPKVVLLRARQPDMAQYGKQFYQEDPLLHDAFKKFIFKFVKLLNTTNDDTDVIEQINGIIDIERLFSMLSLTEDQRSQNYGNMTIKQLSDLIPDFDWKRFIIKGMFKNLESLNVTENDIILVDDLTYLLHASELFKELAENQKRNFKNFLVWSFVRDKTSSLSRKFKEIRLEFDTIYKGTNTIQSRSIYCVNVLLHTMDFAIGRLYVANFFHNESRLDTTKLIDYIQEELKDRLRNSDWMDDFSKKQALAKADAIDRKIGYPDFIFNDTHMNDIYKDYDFTNDDFITNNLILMNVTVHNDLKSYRTERNRTNWISAPAAVNAYYSPELNQICFPSGILQPPFYYYNAPNYLNFGGIGNVIGHEMIHGFDDRGRQFDKDGIHFPDSSLGLWTNETIRKYTKKVQCIIDQYNRYHVPAVNKYLNGIRTQGENIADNGGIKQTYYAYKRWLSKNEPEPLLPGLDFNQDQLFFINYGQIWCSKYRDQAILSAIYSEAHPISEFRLLGSTSNFVEFSKAFQCKPGTRNNPDVKCDIW